MILLDELAERGLSSAEVDLVIVRQGPVDLDMLQHCKRMHPAFRQTKPRARFLPNRRG